MLETAGRVVPGATRGPLPPGYKFYDIAFWSQTSWMWVEAKLTEMGILLATDYQSGPPRVSAPSQYPRYCMHLPSGLPSCPLPQTPGYENRLRSVSFLFAPLGPNILVPRPISRKILCWFILYKMILNACISRFFFAMHSSRLLFTVNRTTYLLYPGLQGAVSVPHEMEPGGICAPYRSLI